MQTKNTIAITGATSHIAKGLIKNFMDMEGVCLYLFARNTGPVYSFLRNIGAAVNENLIVIEGYRSFSEYSYDAIVNCVGLGTVSGEPHIYKSFFMVTEEFDNLIISYLIKSPRTLYINFGSGAVYGRDFDAPAEQDTLNKIRVNAITRDDFFLIAKVNSEAKHRAFDDLNIADIRIFSYFSRFADLNGKYFITELLRSILQNTILRTSEANIVRDYIHPDDLFSLVTKCLSLSNVNAAFDAYSLKSVEKFEILKYFASHYDLKYEFDKADHTNVTGHKNIYYSLYRKAGDLDYQPRFTSMDVLSSEAAYILQKQTTGR